jgi:myxalamid-type polyketide synthase MxaE and MxaD
MRRDEPETHGIPEILGGLQTHGLPVSLDTVLPAAGAPVPLPAYPWQHERFWFRAPGARRPAARPAATAPAPATDPATGSASGPATGAATGPDPVAPPAPPAWTPSANGAGAPDGAARRTQLRAMVLSAVADILEMDPMRVDPDSGFFQMGMDSMLAARVRSRLEAEFGRKLPAPVMFEHPSVEALSCHLAGLAERLAPDRTAQPAEAVAPAPAGRAAPALAAEPATAPVDDLSEDELMAVLAEELRTAPRTAGGMR